MDISRVTAIFTEECVAHRWVKVVFDQMSSRQTTRTALLLQMKLEGLTKGSGESVEGVFLRFALGHRLFGPLEVKDGIPEVSNPLCIGPKLLLTSGG